MDNTSIIRLVLLIIVFVVLVAFLVGFLSSKSTGSCVYDEESSGTQTTCKCSITTKQTCGEVGGAFEEFLDCEDNARKNCK